MTKKHPFDETVDGLFRKLEDALKQRQEAEITITANTAAIRALANTCEDEDVKGDYLLRLEEMGGKQGFKEVVLSMLRANPAGLTPTEIRTRIVLMKKMNLSAYSNPLASIHTTLRRMEGSEVEAFVNSDAEKAWRIKPRPASKAPRPPTVLR
jgi:hypothetical protein